MHTKIFSATTIGIQAHLVEVEVDLSFGLINFFIVGLPDTAIKESRQRIQTALKNSCIKLPERKITVNLAPANLKKEGTLFDLPIAVGIMQAAKYITMDPSYINETIFIGELSLDGTIKPIQGALPITYDAAKQSKKRVILPAANAQEAAMIKNIEVVGVKNLQDLVMHLRGEKPITKTVYQSEQKATISYPDFADVKGQEYAKRALQLAAAGRHNILFYGPPGAGKTMLAKRLPGIMPSMTFDESIATSKIYSISGKTDSSLIALRPFRSPHHSISQAGLVGGGTYPKPGEASLAHNGILFLDELTEFKRDALESLRQSLESKQVEIARAQQTVTYPAHFLLIAALNPCPCGYHGSKQKACVCSPLQIQNYMKKLSGPLLDRIDIKIHVQAVDYETAKTKVTSTSSQELAVQISKALHAQKERFKSGNKFNSNMNAQEVEQHCTLTPEAETIIKKVFKSMNLSMRSYHKILKLARTIADMQEMENIDAQSIQEAVMYNNNNQE